MITSFQQGLLGDTINESGDTGEAGLRESSVWDILSLRNLETIQVVIQVGNRAYESEAKRKICPNAQILELRHNGQKD